jgi:hypothetical protein
MMHSTCSPTTPPRDIRVGIQTIHGQNGYTPGKRVWRAKDFEGNAEPSLDELMDDDVIRRVMARDGVHPDHVRSLMNRMRDRLR